MFSKLRGDIVGSADPIASNPLFEGAEMPMSRDELMASTSPTRVNAPANDVKSVLMVVRAGDAGTARTVSIM
mgnify:CR=1 FL=1|jgi:hypothetical protein